MLAILLATEEHAMRRRIVVFALSIFWIVPAGAEPSSTVRALARQCDQGEIGACNRLLREPQASGATLATTLYIKAEVQRFYTACMNGHVASCTEALRRYPSIRIDDNHDAHAALVEARAKHLRNQARPAQAVARTTSSQPGTSADRGSRLMLALVGVLAGAGLIGGFVWLAQRPPNKPTKVAVYHVATRSLTATPTPSVDTAFPITRHFPTDVRRLLKT